MNTVLNENSLFWTKIASEFTEGNIDEEYKNILRRIATDVGKNEHVIDIATGPGNVALALAEGSGKITAIDTSPEMLVVARNRAAALKVRNIDFIAGSAEGMEFADSSFDAAVICNALPFMENPETALAETKRILKRGGLLVATTVCFGETREHIERAEEMKRDGFPARHLFTPQNLRDLVKESGFVETGFDHLHRYCNHFGKKMVFAHIVARAL